MKKSHLWGVLSACVISLISTHSYATLTYVLGGQAVYDSDADLSWLANANAAVGSAYDTNYPGTGIINWADASAWADGLNINGVTGWRLPDTLQPDNSCSIQGSNSIGYGCTGSEMGNMFYVLGGTTGVIACCYYH